MSSIIVPPKKPVSAPVEGAEREGREHPEAPGASVEGVKGKAEPAPASRDAVPSGLHQPEGVVTGRVAGFPLPGMPVSGGGDDLKVVTTQGASTVTTPDKGGVDAAKAKRKRSKPERARATQAGRLRLPRELWAELAALGKAKARIERVRAIYGLGLAGFDQVAVVAGVEQLRRAGVLLNQSLELVNSGLESPELIGRVQSVVVAIEAMRGGVR